MPEYDLSRNLFSQFYFYTTDKPAKTVEEGAKWFSETAAAARIQNPALFIAMGSIGQLFLLRAIGAQTKSKRTGKVSSDLYVSHSRTINDMIQYVLYHQAAIYSSALRPQ